MPQSWKEAAHNVKELLCSNDDANTLINNYNNLCDEDIIKYTILLFIQVKAFERLFDGTDTEDFTLVSGKKLIQNEGETLKRGDIAMVAFGHINIIKLYVQSNRPNIIADFDNLIINCENSYKAHFNL